jgi:pimeloyl-ACP methyl ester carboxylesterase
MTTAAIVPRNSTIVRSNARPLLAIVRAYFAVASRLVPELARRQAERLFTAPPRYAGRAVAPAVARRETVVSRRHALAVWQAGPAGAPAVLLAHGWGGRGVQMGGFVAPLLERGFRVVWFDQPGHGESGRGGVGLPDFVSALFALASTHGPFAGAIGHSLGAAALGVAMRQGLALDRVALVSPPASITEHTHAFARMLGISAAIREAMRARLERRYGVRFADIDRIDDLARIDVPALVVHDAADREVPFDDAARVATRLPRAALVRTHGLGHFRLLRDAAVVREIADFVRDGVHPQAADLPRLPRPAPLY